jgi:uncharacterized protein with PQ loop repeat
MVASMPVAAPCLHCLLHGNPYGRPAVSFDIIAAKQLVPSLLGMFSRTGLLVAAFVTLTTFSRIRWHLEWALGTAGSRQVGLGWRSGWAGLATVLDVRRNPAWNWLPQTISTSSFKLLASVTIFAFWFKIASYSRWKPFKQLRHNWPVNRCHGLHYITLPLLHPGRTHCFPKSTLSLFKISKLNSSLWYHKSLFTVFGRLQSIPFRGVFHSGWNAPGVPSALPVRRSGTQYGPSALCGDAKASNRCFKYSFLTKQTEEMHPHLVIPLNLQLDGISGSWRLRLR